MNDQEKLEYIPELDLAQYCRCCGNPMWLDLQREKMRCVTPGCHNNGIQFTIPYKAIVVYPQAQQHPEGER